MIDKKLLCSAQHVATELAWQLEHKQKKIVFAESCTAGLTAAILAKVPGISKWLCGSVVTYQDEVKSNWLEVDPEIIREHTSVSPPVTKAMATSVLRVTPEADFSVAITGHLDAQPGDKGPYACVSVGFRRNEEIKCTKAVCYQLYQGTRINRQWEAARAALNAAVQHLHFPPRDDPASVDWAKVVAEPTNYHWDHWFM